MEFVPCVLFRASEKLRNLLVSDGKGKPVELRGRIATSSFDKNGETRYATEVIVDLRDFSLLRYGESKTAPATPAPGANPHFEQKGGARYASNEPFAGGDFSGF